MISQFVGSRFPHLIVSALLYLTCLATPSRANIGYRVTLEHPEQHLFHVMMVISDVRGAVTVQMPAWNALYQIRDFSDHVQQVQAFSRSLDVHRDD